MRHEPSNPESCKSQSLEPNSYLDLQSATNHGCYPKYKGSSKWAIILGNLEAQVRSAMPCLTYLQLATERSLERQAS